MLRRQPAHVHDGPARSVGADHRGGEWRHLVGGGRVRTRGRTGRPTGSQHKSGHEAARHRGDSPGRAHGHEDPMTFSAAWASSTANDDFELEVPGPGSMLSSVLVMPWASMT